MLIGGFAGVAAAQDAQPAAPRNIAPPPDVSVSSVGVQAATDTALRELGGAMDTDLQVGERLRWTLGGDSRAAVAGDGSAWLALLDARFTVDPSQDQPTFEWGAVRQAGFELVNDRWTVDLGRALVYRGGPRLVDGVQALYAPSREVRIGLWGGLAPNLFTTAPMVRPGGGPIVSFENSKTQVSLVGEVLAFDGGIDRVGALAMGRWSLERRVDVSARIDADLVGALGARLVDGELLLAVDPTEQLDLDLMYDAFSSYRYQQSDLLDPDLQRFAQRMEELGVTLGITQDTRDPTLNHLAGASVRWQSDADGVQPMVGLLGRYRYHPDIEDRYQRVDPQAGLMQIGDVLDLTADVNLLKVGEDNQLDLGLTAWFEPPESVVSLDGSVRLLNAPEQVEGRSWYGDLFVNVVSPRLDTLFLLGGSVITEDDLDGQQDAGFGAFVRVAKYLRPSRPAPAR